jgi:hypothetical protein
VPKLFALDQNFPDPIVASLNEFIPEAELVPLREIDPLLVANIEDWQILLALHHHARPWDGLITTDSGMLNLPREIAVVDQTRLTLVVAAAAGHDPLRATGLLFTHLSYICEQTDPAEAQVWRLVAQSRPAYAPDHFVQRIADHQNRNVDEVWREARLTDQELAEDPLAF